MKCDDFLPRLATGGWFSRWLARRHADRCARCAAAAALVHELSAERAEAPLPAHLRRAWLAAGRQKRRLSAPLAARPAGGRRTWRLMAVTCAAACLILLGMTIARRPVKPVVLQAPDHSAAAARPPAMKTTAAPSTTTVAEAKIDAALQLDWLESQVGELQNDVERLSAALHKRELSQQIGSLLDLYSDW